MDLEVDIKEEPVWHEGTANPENFELVSEVVPLKQETKSELIQPGPTQENAFEPSADIKEETFVEQQKVDLLVKEEIRTENVALLNMHTGEKVHQSNFLTQAVTETREGVHSCDVCNSMFTRESNLRRHMVVHTRDKPYHCKECSSTFTQKYYLRKHMVVHTGEKSFQSQESKKSVT